jgi:transposase
MVTYEKEFKEQAVKMAAEVGTAKAAHDLGIPVNTLYGWMNRAKVHGERAHVGSGHKRQDVENDEISRLNKRIKEIERANEILKEALGFFVVSQKK